MSTSQNIIQATDEATDALRLLVNEVAVTGMAIGNTRDNLASLTTAVKDATQQAKTSADSSSKLAKSLNRVTFMLVVGGLIQVVVTVVLALHH